MSRKHDSPMWHGLFCLLVGVSLVGPGLEASVHSPVPVAVTNHAGRVVTGTFGGVTNGTFIVSGRRYPLSILSPAEQQRVKRLAGLDVRTAREKRLDHAREMMLERIRLREVEGEIDHATAERLRKQASGTVPKPRLKE